MKQAQFDMQMSASMAEGTVADDIASLASLAIMVTRDPETGDLSLTFRFDAKDEEGRDRFSSILEETVTKMAMGVA
ncbi:hypothetical protein P7F60_04950 [Rhizobium sp. YJ-22]|uniref:hypothetical protein n=1 Tax=Rhizobium sp. YJ-22 TaxID=3037556 RepID=UPI00241215E2|nr:hypothetical protein [Rhizobium sp. YJ-22]MDG3575723.1 hypothetical protein [Rhizobium sp. YJ-22]